ncbi:MAG TPA: hypothetical protein VIJ44_05515 [Acidimicrobiia bacterium]
MHALLDFHKIWGYVAIAANGLVGVAALVAWRNPRLRGRWLWISILVAEAAILLQVVVGVILQASKQYKAPNFHIFYGVLAFLTVGLAYQYRLQMRGRRELLYGLVGLFIMGLGIRAVLQVTG